MKPPESSYHYRIRHSLKIITYDGKEVELPTELLIGILSTPLNYTSTERESEVSRTIDPSDKNFQIYLSTFREKIKNPNIMRELSDAAAIVITKKCTGCAPIYSFSKS
jgi:hypothetical protein